MGHLKPHENSKKAALFVPNDVKVPLMLIPAQQLPSGFFKRPQDYAHFLFVAEVQSEWRADHQLARGNLLKQLGRVGDIEAETEGILMANNIDTREFPDELLDSLPATVTGAEGRWRICNQVGGIPYCQTELY